VTSSTIKTSDASRPPTAATSPTSTPSPVVEARSVTKSFGKVRALKGLDLSIPQGTITAVLGPNGAGKTTLIRIIATLLEPDSGSVHVLGHDVVRESLQVRKLIGLAGQSAAVEESMTGRENLVMVGRLYGIGRSEARRNAGAVLEQLDLTTAADRQVKTYSGGMRRRLDLGASLVGRPRLLLLDEPTAGLDPGSRLALWDAIKALGTSGTDLLLTTQYLDEADQLAAQIVIVDEGRVISHGTPAELKTRAGTDRVELHTRDDDALGRAAIALGRLGIARPNVDKATRTCSVPASGGVGLLPLVVRALDEEEVEVEDITLRRPTLDEVFLAMTGQRARSGAQTQEHATITVSDS
jgi:ABC-2 type transport system ATP-binding protein